MARITFVSRMTVKPEREAQFIAACRRLEEYVRAHEPDTIYFEFFRLREPRRFAVLESFRDAAAEERHMQSPLLAELLPTFVSSVEGTWEREYFDPLT
ncbi:MAG: antibiotic biosynthesis monooxygenase [Steroidobacteraceae bacterium]|nr:antibiotic biosynthesis monooxygenase [Steroidobacteraceae bacterium]MDW8260212.1 antibiotic biosynthesis monooxygenase family protein [Gammaproteobacteria bacterium]